MKAELKPRINLEGRTALETVIPLATPFVLFVDPSSACNFQCVFCPTGDRALIRETGRFQGALKLELFQKIIDDLHEFDHPLKVLRLYKDGEPLLNKRLPDMIAYAKASGRVNYIDTTTNGYLLTPKNVEKLIASGLDRINISVDGLSDEQFWEFTKTKVNFADFVKNIRHLYDVKGDCEICIKMPGDELSEDEKKYFFDTFGNYCDRISLENFAPCWPEFDVEDYTGVTITEGIYGNEIMDISTCPYIFYSISVNSDGVVSLCFLDWARKLSVGDLRFQTLKEVWTGEPLYRHQVAHLEGRRCENETCGGCGQLSHCLPDNIDPYVDDLLKKLRAARPYT
ncbi:MAG: radical SAM/SPASM domain-containing protein [Pseudomonadota bacterium]